MRMGYTGFLYGKFYRIFLSAPENKTEGIKIDLRKILGSSFLRRMEPDLGRVQWC
jgi:hypothetical protein